VGAAILVDVPISVSGALLVMSLLPEKYACDDDALAPGIEESIRYAGVVAHAGNNRRENP